MWSASCSQQVFLYRVEVYRSQENIFLKEVFCNEQSPLKASLPNLVIIINKHNTQSYTEPSSEEVSSLLGTYCITQISVQICSDTQATNV